MTILRRALRLALPLAFAAAALPAAALDLEAMTDDERAAFRAEVRSYLLDNPEVLMEAISVLESREQAAQTETDRQMVAANLEALEDPETSWIGGNPDGDVTLIEFMDYRCGYCRRAFPEVEELIAADGNIRFILREFPILGEQSLMASRFAIAVQDLHGDDVYKDVHDALMVLRADVSEDSLSRLAEGFGLDPDPILERMSAPEIDEVIAANHQLAQRLDIGGTPTFVLGGDMLRGYVSLEQMQAIVADIRNRG